MRWLSFALLLATTQAQAADLAAVRGVLASALEEEAVFHRCSLLSASARGYVHSMWSAEVHDTLPLLEKAGLPKAEIDAFAATAAEDYFTPPQDSPVGELIAFCAAAGDWEAQIARLQFTIPSIKIAALVGP